MKKKDAQFYKFHILYILEINLFFGYCKIMLKSVTGAFY